MSRGDAIAPAVLCHPQAGKQRPGVRGRFPGQSQDRALRHRRRSIGKFLRLPVGPAPGKRICAHAPTKVTGWRWLDPLRQEWACEVDILPLPWYADEKRGQGAAATFLGLTLKGSAQTGRGVWSASAVGDCCCFQIHRDRLVRSFPLRRSQDFSNRPELLNSKSEDKSSPGHHRRYTRGRWRVKDRFLLMTDAIAHWFLSRHEAKGKPWNLLAPVLAVPQPAQAFESWIEALREHSDLRNDDITIAIIDL